MLFIATDIWENAFGIVYEHLIVLLSTNVVSKRILPQSTNEKLKFQHLQDYYALGPEKQPAKSVPLLLDPSAHQTV